MTADLENYVTSVHRCTLFTVGNSGLACVDRPSNADNRSTCPWRRTQFWWHAAGHVRTPSNELVRQTCTSIAPCGKSVTLPRWIQHSPSSSQPPCCSSTSVGLALLLFCFYTEWAKNENSFLTVTLLSQSIFKILSPPKTAWNTQ